MAQKGPVLITGIQGQVGYEISKRLVTSEHVFGFNRLELDLTRPEQIKKKVNEVHPHWLINLAAYTAVDKAEIEQECAFAVNAYGPEALAYALMEQRTGWLFQVSTDFIFDGLRGIPYQTTDAANPTGVYGASKAEGESRVRGILPNRHIILRTAWVYSAHCNNFVKTMLRLMAERDEVRVVADQIGTPTWAGSLAEAIIHMISVIDAHPQPELLAGTYHFTDAGTASWYDFAVAIAEEAMNLGFPIRAKITPIRTRDYPTQARRPHYSVLDKTKTWDCFGLLPVHWRENLRRMLESCIARME
ncbi:dTDP-4-dehydrorhamnose reductase [Heliophilum fasciatum]|uniref:dTDP-4-dehydrorhamnose reductase n=1 Tax=Heliophilum fasciatum TaxID=35700 RepID=A0A4V2SWX4_9FIRM|nr:dTDP-4-dehydrorhamnose reductase [Heliophilum fasciatum]MCW2278993.1 dTDP-4-dehydrorhamnose reductase [Heliophilum fasciatum]TCP64056.1 dTDP-4-dehydrorhamnose reductase [Heliophilum fasciatum]